MAALPTSLNDVGTKLAIAMVASSEVPLILLDEALTVVAASGSFCRTFHIDPLTVAGINIYALGDGEWDVPRLKSLLSATLNGYARVPSYEMDLNRKDAARRCLVLNAQKLDYGEGQQVRLLLTISDVTDARLAEKIKDDLLREKDDLVRDKAILLQEVQHRVANSLQIIASVLLQSARKVQSEESKVHLHDAHHRVMSIAAVQRQLASSHVGEVQLRDYFTQLCQSLGASMIQDHERILFDVDADDSRTTADTSVSLGLIVTELVINALKHAFPDQRSGKIIVGYESGGGDWSLSVNDDGVGMPSGSVPSQAGLGTSIVEALARQLNATVRVGDNKPGTSVSVAHAAVSGQATPEPVLEAV